MPRVKTVRNGSAVKERLYGGLSAAERRAERRARLLDAALLLFGTNGFAGTTISALCVASGVTERHFYEEFASRDALLRAVYDDIAHSVFTLCVAAMDERLPPHARVRASNLAYFRYLTADARRARIYVMETVGVSDELEQHRRATRERFVKSIAKGLEQLEQRAVPLAADVRLLSSALAGATHELLREWILSARKPSVERLAETVSLLWMRTLGYDDAA